MVRNEARTKLAKEIISLSESNDWVTAKQEWFVASIYKSEDAQTCLCGHNPIIEICIISNKLNSAETMVGNCCVTRFMDIPSNKLFRSYNLIVKDKSRSANMDLLTLVKERQLIHEWEYNFSVGLIRKRNLSQAQLNVRSTINTKIISQLNKKKILSEISKIDGEPTTGKIQLPNTSESKKHMARLWWKYWHKEKQSKVLPLLPLEHITNAYVYTKDIPLAEREKLECGELYLYLHPKSITVLFRDPTIIMRTDFKNDPYMAHYLYYSGRLQHNGRWDNCSLGSSAWNNSMGNDTVDHRIEPYSIAYPGKSLILDIVPRYVNASALWTGFTPYFHDWLGEYGGYYPPRNNGTFVMWRDIYQKLRAEIEKINLNYPRW